MLLVTPYSLPNIIQYATPILADTVVILSATNTLILEPAGTIAAATVTLPSSNLYDGKKVTICCTQVITTLTFNGGTIINGIAAFAAGGVADYTYRGANGNWYKTG